MTISKKIRITIILSAIWFMLVLIYAIETTEKGRYFHFDQFFLVLIIGAMLPLLVLWGIIWIRSASKSEDKGHASGVPLGSNLQNSIDNYFKFK